MPHKLTVDVAVPGALRGQYQAFTLTKPTDFERERAKELLHKWVDLSYLDASDGRRISIEGTLNSVTEDDGELILDLILKFS